MWGSRNGLIKFFDLLTVLALAVFAYFLAFLAFCGIMGALEYSAAGWSYLH